MALALFVVVKFYNRFRDKDEKKDTGPSTNDLLAEIRDELRKGRG